MAATAVILPARISGLFATLDACLAAASAGDRSFATSVMETVRRSGRMSDRQEACLKRIADKAANPAPAPQKAAVGDVKGILALFGKARSSGLKRPAVVFTVADEITVKVAVAGEGSKEPGTLIVTDAAKSYGEPGQYFGRIRLDGQMQLSPALSGSRETAITTGLSRFAADPAGVAAHHGKLTGKCTFCNTGLKDKRSTEVGYGPTCAKRFDLAWG